MGHAETSQTNIEKALGAALLVGAAAMVIRYFSTVGEATSVRR
jgi:hypothetical protein